MKNLLVWGALGQAKVLNEFVNKNGFKIVALIDKNKALPSPFDEVPIYYGIEEFIESALFKDNDEIYFSVAIGGMKLGSVRMEIHELLLTHNFKPCNLIHPTGYVAGNANMGTGNQILAKSVVCAEVKIGNQCIINTAATVDHETVIGDGVHICPGVTVLGNVKIENYVSIGAGAVIFPNITIGQGAIIGAGAIVRKNVPANSVVIED